LRWEYWDGAWLPLTVDDETSDLTLPGMLGILWPGSSGPPPAGLLRAAGESASLVDGRDGARFAPGESVWIADQEGGELGTVTAVSGPTVTLAAPLSRAYGEATMAPPGLARFGSPRTWVRARTERDGPPPRRRLDGAFVNAVWASQHETVDNELLGSAVGEPGESLFFRRSPVLPGEIVEVRELEGGRAAVEHPRLLAELKASGVADDAVRTVADPRTGEITEVWVAWHGQRSLAFSSPDDRHYVIERTLGRVTFGGRGQGRPLPPGTDNVRARRYRTGGGTAGNVAAGELTQILSGVLAQAVTNPLPAEGGADGEPADAVLGRGPRLVRCRNQAVTLVDYEVMALEATPEVAVARATAGPSGITLMVVPRSADPRPTPSFPLRRAVT
jgi:hypothetical protein